MSAERICTLCKVTTSTRFRLLSKGKWSELTRNHTVELTWKEVCFNHLIVDMVTNHFDSLSDCPVETVRSIIRQRTASSQLRNNCRKKLNSSTKTLLRTVCEVHQLSLYTEATIYAFPEVCYMVIRCIYEIIPKRAISIL